MREDIYMDHNFEDNLDMDQDYWDYCDEYYDEDLQEIENADLTSASFFSSMSVSEW